ncbi:uncharacterized protein LOC128982371 [Macrosteles quadrilineatus]|uniref:uncharacterized protein LOC128982370 n=1 Tax=Macrosteles quadrilineatus TaxID=74068 RepID=UPI0023E0D6BE|nr:uncharacterized protein LOC128982370 [Macrosteles quadrilineatus]XP_054257304.1 uncharacterized protein LOC128982371 [Macrosteles quadrilineatus]
MANPDDPDFNVFVNDLMNASFSSAYVDMDIDDSDREDALIYNNPGESESDGEVSQPPQPLALPLDSQPPVTPLQPPALPGSTTDTSHTTYDDLINDIGLTNTSFSSIIDVMEIDSDRKDISVTSPPVSLPTPVTPLPTPLPTPVTPLPAPLPTSVTPLPTPLPTPVTPLPAPLPTSVTPLPAPLPTPITDPQPPARAKRSRGVKRAPVTPPAPQPTPVTTPQPPAPAKRSRRVTRTPVTPPPAPQAQPPPDSADLPTAQLSDWVDVTDNDPGPSHTIPIYSVSAGPVLPAAFDSEQFRTCLVKSLVEEKLANRPIARKRGRPVYGPPNQRLDGNPHFMDRKEKGANRCVVCFKNGRRRETIYFCKTCDSRPALHPDTCFEQFHTMAEY